MAPFEALYGRRCTTLLSWSESGERRILGPDLVTQAEEKAKIIQKHLKTAQSRQKSYQDQRRRPLEFSEGDHVYLKVSQTRGIQRFGIKGKLAPRYIRPYPIAERCGPVAYRVLLPDRLTGVHNVFHVSQLKKCLRFLEEEVLNEDLQLEPDLTYAERPIKILDQKDRATRRKTIRIFKVQWSNHTEEEATWEQGSYLAEKYPGFLEEQAKVLTPRTRSNALSS